MAEDSNRPKRATTPAMIIPLRPLFAAGFLLVLAEPLTFSLQDHPAGWHWAVVIAGVALFALLYGYIMLRGPRLPLFAAPARQRHARYALLGLACIACLLSVVDGASWLLLFIFTSVCVGKVEPVPGALRLIGGLALVTLALGLVDKAAGHDLLQLVLLVSGGGFIMVTYARLAANIHELQAAREEIARLAITQERLRFARDLHDLLGHTLSLLALKSELAGRLIHTAPERADAEIHEVEREARAALQEIREAVASYRQPTLAHELSAARELLTAAGIVHRCEGEQIPLPPATEAVCAWAVREGVTNVIRHSRARHCTIRVARADDEITVAVIDDGQPAAAHDVLAPGNGLRGLAERAGMLGGTCDARALSGGGFQLSLALPLSTPRSSDPVAAVPLQRQEPEE